MSAKLMILEQIENCCEPVSPAGTVLTFAFLYCADLSLLNKLTERG